HLLPAARSHITEVFNSSFYYKPESRALAHYYQAYNQQQGGFGANPDVGAQRGRMRCRSGRKNGGFCRQGFPLDQSQPGELQRVVEFWKILMRSGAPGMLESGSITQTDVDAMESDLDRIVLDENAVFFYQFVQAKATL